MKLTQLQVETIANKVLNQWKNQNLITFKVDEKKVLSRMIEELKKELQKEQDLELEVNRMLDQLERSNPGEFQRYKMYPILKKKMAKEKKVIL